MCKTDWPNIMFFLSKHISANYSRVEFEIETNTSIVAE